MNLFNKALIFFCVFVIAFLTPSYGQEAEWMIEPFIGKTKDLIAIYEKDEIIHFTRDGKEGVVNFKNEVILPAQYDKIKIYQASKYINAKIDREVFHYDFEGYELEEEMEQEAIEAEWAAINLLNAEKASTFNKENENFNLVEVGIQPKDYKDQLMGYALLTANGDTLINRVEVLDNFLAFGKNHMVHQGKKIIFTSVYNSSGDTFFEEKNYAAKAKVRNGWNIIELQKTDALYNDQMELITDKYDNIYPFNNLGAFSYREGRSTYLLDANAQAVNDTAYAKIQQINETKFLILKKGELGSIYDTGKSEFVELKYPITKVQNESLSQISKYEGKLGILNVESNELIVPHYYEEMKFKNGLFLANNVIEEVGEEKLRAYKVFNESGEVVYEVKAFKVYLHDDYILVSKDENEKSKLVSKDGEILMTSGKGEKFNIVFSSPWVAVKKDNRTTKYLFQSILDDNPQGYFYAGKVLRGSEDGEFPTLYVAGKGHKKEIGAIDEEGNVIIPMVYPEIEIKKLCGQRYLISRSRPYGPIGIIQKWH